MKLNIDVTREDPHITVYRNVDTGKLEFHANSTEPVVMEDETEMLASLIRMVTTKGRSHSETLETQDSRLDGGIS